MDDPLFPWFVGPTRRHRYWLHSGPPARDSDAKAEARERRLTMPEPGKQRWNEILGLSVHKQSMLDELAHGLVTPESLAWICEMVRATTKNSENIP